MTEDNEAARRPIVDSSAEIRSPTATGLAGVRRDTHILYRWPSQGVTTTTANGLGKTVQLDHTGNAAFDLTVADTITPNTGSGSTETVAATNNDGSLRGKSITMVSADDLTTTVKTDADGNGTM